MKYILFIFISLLSGSVFSQLTVNAGPDAVMCVNADSETELFLGGDPTVTGGTSPYIYTWEINYEVVFGSVTYILTASDFLSDSTLANPEVIITREDPAEFILTVTDSEGLTSKDTVIVTFSIFNVHLIEYEHNMLAGDSVEFVSLPNVSGGIEPVTYLWRPNHGLIDSTSFTGFWVKPITNTSYYLTVTDAAGCIATGTPVFHVYVGHLSIAEIMDSGTDQIVVYPNPATNDIFIVSDNSNFEVSVYDSKNALVKDEKNAPGKIDISGLPAGEYTIMLRSKGELLTRRLIVSR